MDELENAEIQIRLTVGEVNLILTSLAELPFKVSWSVIQKIKQQGDPQIASAAGKPSATAPADVSPSGSRVVDGI